MAKKNSFLKGAGNVATNYGLALGDTALSTVGLTDVVRDDMYKGSTATGFAKAGNIGGAVMKTAAPLVLNTVVPGSGAFVAAGQQAVSGTANQALLDKQAEKEAAKQTIKNANQPLGTALPQNNLGSYQTYKEGGEAKGIVVNIEKDELEVDPKTGEIISDYEDKPKHPKGKDIVNLKGNVSVQDGSVIIPAKYRKDYMEGGKEVRLEIIHEVLESQMEREGENGKMGKGGFNPNEFITDSNEEIAVPKGDGISDQNAWMATTGGDKTDYANYVNQSGGTGYKYPTATGGTDASGGGSMSGVDSGTIGALATGAVNLGFSAQQARESKKALEKLQKTPKPKYAISPELQAGYAKAQGQEKAALGRARTGYSPEERAAFEQNMGRLGATQYGNMVRAGVDPRVSQASNKAAGVNALLQFAASDAQKRQQNIQYADQAGIYTNQIGGQISDQRNRMVGSELQQRLQQEQALGQALQQGRVGTANALGSMAGYGAMGYAQSQGASAPAPSGDSYAEYQAWKNSKV